LDIADVIAVLLLAGAGLAVSIAPSAFDSLAAGLFIAKVLGTIVLLVGSAVLVLVCLPPLPRPGELRADCEPRRTGHGT
jgi:hypothetical protein